MVGQDWGCPFNEAEDILKKKIDTIKKQEMDPSKDSTCHYFDEENLDRMDFKTDQNLKELFFEVDSKYKDLFHTRYDDLYFTNLSLGYRSKGTSGNFKRSWVTEIEKAVFPRMIEILKPKVIICLGKDTFECFKKVMMHKTENVVEQSIDRKLSFNEFIVKNRENPLLVNGIPVFAFAHCGSMGSLNRNGRKSGDLATQKEDWSYIKKYCFIWAK